MRRAISKEFFVVFLNMWIFETMFENMFRISNHLLQPYVWHMLSKHDFWNHYCPKPILQNQILPNHLQFFKHVSSNRRLSNHIFPTKFWNHCAPHAIEPQLLNQHLFKHVSFTFILLIVLISGQHIVSIFVRNHFPTSWVIPPLGLSFMFRMLECNHGVYFP